MRRGDALLISPTGSGKSLTWILPLLARKEGMFLVVTPYTSLGLDGELSAKQPTGFFEKAATGEMLVIYFRKIVGLDTPLIALSATCPELYRHSLLTFAGLRMDYTLINHGNFRPELSTIILPMLYDITSFLDIAFILPLGTREADLVPTIVYADDLELLTKMFWWAFPRAASMGIPTHAIDIIHSGLSVSNVLFSTSAVIFAFQTLISAVDVGLDAKGKLQLGWFL
ncbi:hypothetical protein GGX14DRAFT_404312 [Mycena pura]|uniref:Helicase ATP-binding domain-containing protein n=1 Tax=Mycena pura TaxID=153505 RepID=A0AAD6UUC1_9AGAR|nr:hypothetical protein GGX14DRAFT_404312 [Mycena pura]